MVDMPHIVADPKESVAEHEDMGHLSHSVFPFLKLPRELRDQIYNDVFDLQDTRSQRALRIERRNLRHFKPSAAAILLVLHHEDLLLNRQVAREALEILFKHHTVFLSCGPYVLKALLEIIETYKGHGRRWLRWIASIELDWVTFPNLKLYPPDRMNGRDQWYWEQDEEEVDVDYIRGAQYSGEYDDYYDDNSYYDDYYDHEGNHYDDNFYDPHNSSLYPSFQQPTTTTTDDDPFGLATHYPFTHPTHSPANQISHDEISTKLDLLISMEVTPLFTYLASPTFNITHITLPLYFISKEMHHARNIARPGYTLPLKVRYWVQVCVHAFLMLATPSPSPSSAHTSSRTSISTPTSTSTSSTLQRITIKYMPWDIWASMNPADDLSRIVSQGVWFDGQDDNEGGAREQEGEAFKSVWKGVRSIHAASQRRGAEDDDAAEQERFGLQAAVEHVPWDGNIDSARIGDELEIVFRRVADQI